MLTSLPWNFGLQFYFSMDIAKSVTDSLTACDIYVYIREDINTPYIICISGRTLILPVLYVYQGVR